jgi:hypothetical protein
MKKIACLILVAATFNCCKKGTDDHSAGEKSIVAKWEIRKSVGGIWGTLNYQPGNGNIIEFKSDNSYTTYQKDTIIYSGTYDLLATSETDNYTITFHGQRMEDQSWHARVNADILELSKAPECCDVPNYHKYVRVN